MTVQPICSAASTATSGCWRISCLQLSMISPTATGNKSGQSSDQNMVAGLVAGFGDNHCDSVSSIETRPAPKNTDDRHRSPPNDSPQLPAVASSCGSLRHDEKESGSGWESNPPGDFSDATMGLKPRAVTRSAYTPGRSTEPSGWLDRRGQRGGESNSETR